MTLVQTSEAVDLAALHPADAVEAINEMAPEDAAPLLASMDFRAAVAIFDQAGLERGVEADRRPSDGEIRAVARRNRR